QHFCPKYSRELQARSSNPNSKTQLEFNMSKMAAFNLLAAAALLCCIGCCTAQHGRPNEKYTYIGCYGDTTRRDLSSYVAHSRMSVEFCYRQCDRLRYRYFGLQNGRLCFCGNTYGLYGRKSERECNRRCNGNRDEFCGGRMRNCIYEIHREQCECDRKPNA
uniref:WSC domain-containing protein n=2 Tax=Macrostomum lignano TaxID=282301 RepID=A0A1I8J3T1_9PLAT